MKITEAYLKANFDEVVDDIDGSPYRYYEKNLTDGAFMLSDAPFDEVVFGEHFERTFTTVEEVDMLIKLWSK